jgi:hypothetical protein
MRPRYIEFVIRVHADGRRERHARLYVEDGEGGGRLERRPDGEAAAWAQRMVREEWLPLRRAARRPRD